MTNTNVSNNETNSNVLETSLKEVLDKMLTYFEKFIKTKDDLASIEDKLNDYENVTELVEIIKSVFTCLTEKIDEKISDKGGENYDELEKSLQQHESEIRNHIRIEQQLKLYAESIQQKLDDSEKAKGELEGQNKAIVASLKKDNQRLADILKQKNEDYDKLQASIKSLEDKNKEYESKLQNLPQLQDRINHLEKRQRPPSANPGLKDSSSAVYGIENAKKIDIDFDYSKIASKPDSARKSIKALVGGTSHPSPLRLINKTFSNAQSATNKSKDSIRTKVEITDPKHRKDLESLKQSYQKFYNPTKSNNRDKERERERGSSSVQRTRELKSIYSIPVVSNSSNISLVQFNNNNLSQRDLTVTKLHQRSNSIGARHKIANSFSRT